MKTDISGLVLRYLIMILAGIFLDVFYIIFTPLTVYPVYFLLSLIYPASLSGVTLIIGDREIELINACIAGSAYFLLFVLNLSTEKIKLKKRALILLVDFSALLVLNILRIFLLSILLIKETVFFETVHIIFWYLLSIVLVFLIWILTAKIFQIKAVPFYSDFASIKRLCRKKKK